MFYRRKVILSLLQIFDDELDKIRLQKLLFLFSQRQGKAEYEFIPYHYGCFSYSLQADLKTMVKKGLLSENNISYKKQDDNTYLKDLRRPDLDLLHKVKSTYGKMNSTALMKHTYINYPFYATKSKVAKEILTESEFQKIIDARPTSSKTILYTIGYEGISLEQYFVRLIKNDVRLLIDVRRNPISMKFGFSKTQLNDYCHNLNIEYKHFPELGIESQERRELNTQNDYDHLFNSYKSNNLPKTINKQTEILKLLNEYERIALTCFEANICQCHRKHLAEAIEHLPAFDYEVKHL